LAARGPSGVLTGAECRRDRASSPVAPVSLVRTCGTASEPRPRPGHAVRHCGRRAARPPVRPPCRTRHRSGGFCPHCRGGRGYFGVDRRFGYGLSAAQGPGCPVPLVACFLDASGGSWRARAKHDCRLRGRRRLQIGRPGEHHEPEGRLVLSRIPSPVRDADRQSACSRDPLPRLVVRSCRNAGQWSRRTWKRGGRPSRVAGRLAQPCLEVGRGVCPYAACGAACLRAACGWRRKTVIQVGRTAPGPRGRSRPSRP